MSLEIQKNYRFNIQQKASLALIQTDLRYLYTIYTLTANKKLSYNYWVSCLPYFGLIIDGAEDWIEAYNRSSKVKLQIEEFTPEEQCFYENARSTIKLWSKPYSELYHCLKRTYIENNVYFSSLCKPIAKWLHLYDVFGVNFVNGHACSNTVLENLYIPGFAFKNFDSKKLMAFSTIAGKYTYRLGACNAFPTNPEFHFVSKDYGGIEKLPIGNSFSDKFVLFCILCQIQYVLYGVDDLILCECPTKLRFLYLQYYYICGFWDDLNNSLGTNFSMNEQYASEKFRNAMAHYKMGVALKPNEIICDDPLFGLTQKYFNCDYAMLKRTIKESLLRLANQLNDYLKLV